MIVIIIIFFKNNQPFKTSLSIYNGHHFETVLAIMPFNELNQEFAPKKLCAKPNLVKFHQSVWSLSWSHTHRRKCFSLSLGKRMRLPIKFLQKVFYYMVKHTGFNCFYLITLKNFDYNFILNLFVSTFFTNSFLSFRTQR